MRGNRESRHVIYINWDGFAYTWYRMVNDHYSGTPHLNALIDNGALCTKSETGVPSITGAMQQCIVSGAWPVDTGNHYKYYNKEQNSVIQYARDNRLENIVEAAQRHDITVASVNAWYFENRGTAEGDTSRPYIKKLPSNFSVRIDEMIKIIHGEPVETGDKSIVFEELPRLLSVYADDIDSVGHNFKTTYAGLSPARTRQQWYDNIAETIMRMDADLGRLVAALSQQGLLETTTIILTTDHGMIHYGLKSRDPDGDVGPGGLTSLHDLADTIAQCGQRWLGRSYNVEVLAQGGMQAKEDTEIVVVPVAVQAQISFRCPIPSEAVDDMLSQLKGKTYYGKHLMNDELIMRGVAAGYADLLISACPPYHFRPGSETRMVEGNHDSLHEQVRHIFTMFSGADILPGILYDSPVSIVDIAPTIARLLGFEGPGDAVGTALDGVLISSLRGPKLQVKRLEEHLDAGDTVVFAGMTEAEAELKVNGKLAGQADAKGEFVLTADLLPGMNRFVIQAKSREKFSRKTIYVYREE
ncbi:alkaline phosphatase family protein [Paenibacillus chungangensis]|uniref:Alkaline phosphatase family protein n=1 Tax=Paenibacillus chungangensis TaxID=696535 RepID=A0ABW3HQX9_9BACL